MPRAHKAILLCLSLALLPAILFYTHFERFSSRLEKELHFTGGQSNAAKHAYAAARVYQGLRIIGCPPPHAERLVITLGKANEYAEVIVKFFKPDSPQEVLKDMYNNKSGIAAAEWATTHRIDIQQFITTLAQHHCLLTSVDRITSEANTIHAAMDEFNQNEDKYLPQHPAAPVSPSENHHPCIPLPAPLVSEQGR